MVTPTKSVIEENSTETEDLPLTLETMETLDSLIHLQMLNSNASFTSFLTLSPTSTSCGK